MSITYGAIRLSFIKSQHKKIPGYIANAVYTEDVSKEYKKEWDLLPVGTHLITDFKQLRTDKDGNIPYKELVFNDLEGNKMKALVRYLYEIDDMDADNPECQEYYETYTDLIHCNQCFMIVKITNYNTAGYTAKDKFKIGNGHKLIFEPFSNMTPIPEDTNMVDTDNSMALF